MNPIYLGTIALEVNRHARGRVPTYQVSQWLDKILEAGFDGIELWENHAMMADTQEVERLKRGGLAVYNSYATLDDAGAAHRARAAELARALNARAVKYNFSNKPEQRDQELANLRAWAQTMPGVLMLCECHGGTMAETPAAARALLEEAGPPAQFAAIVHARGDRAEMAAWVEGLGGRVVHVHVGGRKEGQWAGPADAPELYAQALDYLRELRWSGTVTLEFTGGQTIEALYASACRDLSALRLALG